MSSKWNPLAPDWDPLTPERFLFTLVYSAIFFPIWVGVPYFVIGWIAGPVPEWFTALLVIVSFYVFGPFCRQMRVWFGPWQKFHAWAYKKPSA